VAQGAIRTFGGLRERTIEVNLPDMEPRTLIVIRKTAPTPPRYPRRAGIVQKRPL
jgi:16S rRNA (guanine527-N7)-methyltransferase